MPGHDSGHPPHRLGQRGEAYAARYLRERGWRIEARGYRLGRREIDIIAKKGPLLAFVEVKTRAGRGWGPPEEAVTARKRREIEAVAQAYLLNARPDVRDIRFDVIALEVDGQRRFTRCDHIEDAWRPGAAR